MNRPPRTLEPCPTPQTAPHPYSVGIHTLLADDQLLPPTTTVLAHTLLTTSEVTRVHMATGTDSAQDARGNGMSCRTLLSSKTTEVEPTEEAARGSALVPYTSGSAFSPTAASSAKQQAQLLYIPPAIKRSFLLLAHYYSSPKSLPPSPITSAVLNFLHSFIKVNSNSPLSPIAPRADIEEHLLSDTIRWAHARGLPFADPRLALVPQSLQPVHQAALLPFQPVHQADRQSQPPVHQAALLPFQPVHQALVPQSLQPVHQAALLPFQPVHQADRQSQPPVHQATEYQGTRRLQIQYDLPAGVDAVPGSPGTVLIPLQVENSSKKRKVRLRLATLNAVSESGELSNTGELSDAISESRELPDASPITFPKNLPDDFKLLSLADKMAEKAMK